MSEYTRTLYCPRCDWHTPHLTSGSGRSSCCEYCGYSSTTERPKREPQLDEGTEVVVGGQACVITQGYDPKYTTIFVCDQDGGEHEIKPDDIDHVYT